MATRMHVLVWLTTLALVLSTVDTFAQFGSRGGMGGGSRGGRGNDGGNSENRSNRQPQPDVNSYEQIEYRLSLLEEDLKLKQAQVAPWNSFAERVRAYAGDLARERARAMTMSSTGGTATDGIKHIEQAADSARNRATALDDIAAAAKALYASLTPEQKMLADTRVVTIIAPLPRAATATASGSGLPDLGSSSRPQR
jgi:LTXXQ motif family protein